MSRKNMYIQKELKNKCDICDSLKKACWNGEFWQKHLVKTVFVYFQIWIEEGCSFFLQFLTYLAKIKQLTNTIAIPDLNCQRPTAV